ncbi:BamA/TamA family outer membrane protein [Trichocoleus sp. FACHB-591]|uniref:BamA/TamA family outer membrane protein n=1 Tax=Trichocoleus sp. FACHB-591 TaxID=2692872 RepID=UPI001F5492F9|nr:BamA/TamA family outer membrane protein [Trichocoleus sp. FACHB-591]
MPNHVNTMRLSPVLVAIIAASATLNLSTPARGQTSAPTKAGVESSKDVKVVATSPTAAAEVLKPASLPAIAISLETAKPGAVLASNSVVVPTVSEPEVFPAEFRAQAPTSSPTSPTETPTETTPTEIAPTEITPTNIELDSTQETPPAPGGPPPGTATPEQETPNEIQLDGTPAPGPSIDFNLPPQTPTTPTTPANGAEDGTNGETQAAPEQAEPRVLVAEVVVQGVTGELEDEVYNAIRTRPGRTTTRSQLQEDINAVFATGFFSSVRANPSDTPLGVRVTFDVQANPVLNSVRVEGNQVLPQSVVDDIFKEQYGSILNLRRFQEGVKEVNKWYQDKGYVLAQVIDTPQVAENGTVTLAVAEGVVEDVQVKFLNKDGEETNDEGEPVRGRTRDFIITREFALKPGDVFNRTQAEKDLQRVYGLGIFEDVRLSLNPGQDPRKVVVVANVTERSTGSAGAALGISSASGLFGSVSYQQQNLGGNNQKFNAEVQVGQRELLFDVSFTDPWIAGDPYRTSYTLNVFNRRSLSLIFDGGEPEVELPNGDRPRIDRLGGGITFTRPLSRDVFADSEWTASAGLQYQRVSVRDSDREITPFDELGNQLSFSDDGSDNLLTAQLGLVRDRRNNRLRPTSGSLLRFGTEQSIPIGGIFFNRLRGSYSYYIPVDYTKFAAGPEALAFNVQAGTVIGDLPPYEAFALGGSNSVRGFDEGDVGSGRSFIQATAEYRFPLFSILGGALFLDYATDLGSGSSVPGDPAGVRGKPGSGLGYGVGVRIQSPLGPIRIDYGFNDDGNSRLHFGIGERF